MVKFHSIVSVITCYKRDIIQTRDTHVSFLPKSELYVYEFALEIQRVNYLLFRLLTVVCNKSNTTGVTSGTGTAYPSESTEFSPGFQWVLCRSIFSFLCNVL
jgi:hypothetical protein